MEDIKEDMPSLGLALRGTIDLTNDRRQWQSFSREHRRQELIFIDADEEKCKCQRPCTCTCMVYGILIYQPTSLTTYR